MKRLIMGTAGHIDHGKTTLVKMLTGIDADRLAEEKKRGITIELGFAHMDLASGVHIGIVDVPGHEKFVRTMVAGAGGIDFVCMVIAADEGVMPQSEEHLNICKLLSIKTGLIALTKTDMVDSDWLEMVTEDLSSFVQGTFLEDAPIIPISSKTGQGKEELIAAIDQVAQGIDQRPTNAIFRLPVDRVFTMKGFGTVITGSGLGGEVSVGETLEILPSGKTAKVRGLQVHNESVEKAGAGLRTAVNLQGLAKEDINRGEVLVKPNTLPITYMLDAKVELLPTAPRPLEARTRVRFHHLSSEIMARVIPLSDEVIRPGEQGLIQLRLEQPHVALPHDRFVLRSYSPVTTIGGGQILHPTPSKHKRPFDDAIKALETLETGQLPDRVALLFQDAGKQGLPFSNLPALLGAGKKELTQVYRDLLGKGVLVRYDSENDVAVFQKTFEEISDDVLLFLEKHHQKHPTLEGVNRQELAAKIHYGTPSKLMAKVVSTLEKDNQVKRNKDIVGLIDHNPTLKGDLEELGLTILGAIVDGKYTPPTLKELTKFASNDAKKTQQILDLLAGKGKIIRIAQNLYYDADALKDLQNAVIEHLKANEELDAQAFKAISGTSRKYSIPLLEYFDAAHITLRVGDKRVLRKK